MHLRTPWYNRKYEMKNKVTATSDVKEFTFKESIPSYKMVQEMKMKAAVYDKNEKTQDPNCTSNNPKDCEVKTPVGKQNKWEFEGEHKNDAGKFKVFEKNNYVTYLDGRPWSVSYSNGWDFNIMDGEAMMAKANDVANMVGMGSSGDHCYEHMDDHMEDDMENDMDDDMDNEPTEMEMEMHPWWSKGGNVITANWEYEKSEDPFTGEMKDHWKHSEWSFAHHANHTDAAFIDMQIFGSSHLDSFELSNNMTTAEMKVSYDQDSNIGWSDNGVNTQTFDNVMNCMELMRMICEGDWENFFGGSFGDKPCVWTSMIEGESSGINMETIEEYSTPYAYGISHEVADILNWELSYLQEGEMMPLFKIESEMNDEDERETTISIHGNEMFTANCDKLMAHHEEEKDKVAKFMFMMYKKGENMIQKMMEMDWSDEDQVREHMAKFWNMDYAMSIMAEHEQNMLQEWREIECMYPHYNYMAEMGLTIHPAMQEMCYGMKTKFVQHMELLEEVHFKDLLTGYTKFIYDPTGCMTSADIYKKLFDMELADAYEYVAKALDKQELMFAPSTEFMVMVAEIDMEDTSEMWPETEEEWQALYAAFEQNAITRDQLREYAEKIREFEIDEEKYTHENLDEALNAMCNAQFDKMAEWHQSKVDEKVGMWTMMREQATYWTEKNYQWMTTERQEVENMYDECIGEVMTLMEGLWECEYLMFGAPNKLYFDQLTEECQGMMSEKYEGIESWGLDGVLEDEDMEEPQE
jgi:hypothetical protein